MLRFIYTALLIILFPVVLLIFLRLSSKNKAWRQRFTERLGYLPSSLPRHALWLHAASVGEVQACVPLVKAWQQAYPKKPIVISTFTPTGAEHVARVFAGSVHHVYLPLDYPWAVQGFLRALKPSMLVLMERELWPNLLAGCQHFQVPVLLANARLSERSLRGYQRLHWGVSPMLQAISHVAAHSLADAERFVRLGVAAERVSVVGSVKFDIQVPPQALEQGQKLRRQWGKERRVLALASSHEGEDELLLHHFSFLKTQFPDLLLMLIPRHPERFDAVVQKAAEGRWSVCRRSSDELPTPTTEVYIGDTMGEMLLMLSAADVVIVGGSLIDDGGHNPIEPAALGKATLMGPFHQHFASIVADLMAEEAMDILSIDAEPLRQRLYELLASEAQRTLMGQRAFNVVEDNRGAVQQLLQLMVEMNG